MSTNSFTVFGIPMQRQASRRRLVAGVYALLAILWAVTVLLAPKDPWIYSYAVFAVFLVSGFVFGGIGQRGLIKGFENKPPRPEPPQVEVVRLHLTPQTMTSASESAWRNDERELQRRDRAHYYAYQTVFIAISLILALSALAQLSSLWIPVRTLLLIIFAVAEIAMMLCMTLPAAIILWTEPDMELEFPVDATQGALR